MLQAVNMQTAREYLVDTMLAKKVPMLHGSPGIGKSAMVASICEEYGLKLIDLRLSQLDPTDLNGFAVPNQEKGLASYLPLDTFPLEHTPIPKGYNGFMVFLDEINSAALSLQKAAYKLILDRMVGQHKLHENTVIVGAGNLETDNAIVTPLGTAMQSRLVHIILDKNDHKYWLDVAMSHGVDHRITDYIKFRPEMVNNFNPDHSDMTFACQRTWFFLSDLTKRWEDIPESKLNLMAGIVGLGVAREFYQFTKIYNELPSLEEVVKDPDAARLPSEPDRQYAMTGMLSNNINASNDTQVLTYINRLPKEFQVVAYREVFKRYPPIENHQIFIDKIAEVADML